MRVADLLSGWLEGGEENGPLRDEAELLCRDLLKLFL